MKKFLGFIFKQYDIGQWWGGFSTSFGNITMFVTLFNTILLIPMAYVTWFTPWISGKGLVIPFTVFISVIFVAGIVMMLVGYKVLTPSGFSFWNEQWWRHNNPVKKRMDILDKRLKSIEKTLKDIKKGQRR